jgi:hypothetical protein
MKTFNEKFLELKVKMLEDNLACAVSALESCHKVLAMDIVPDNAIRFLVADDIYSTIETLKD